ncbi:cytochrome P450 2J4-like [Clavelina lepadiformis]|uniref:cytochrome P450 2J4-like n=1 Tax=Clavelina lepadiformis TaxID=159417 RepID=UPI0040439355
MFTEFVSTVSLQLYSAINLWTVLALLIVAFYQWWKKPHPNFPPGPRGVPILGALPWLTNPQDTFLKWGQKYGPVMSVRMAGVDTVFLNTYDAINTALVKHGEDFSGRPPLRFVTDVIGHNGIILTDYGDRFRHQRKFALHSLKKLGMGKQEMEKSINEEVHHFAKYLKSKLGKPIDLSLKLETMTSNVICLMAFGQRFGYDHAQFKQIIHVLHNMYTEDESLLMLLIYFYEYVHFIPPFKGAKQRFWNAEKAIADVWQPIIDEHKKNFNPDCIRDYIDAFLYEQKYGKQKEYFTDTQLKVVVRDLFQGGTESTSSTLAWLYLALLNYPVYHKQIVAEVDTVIGSNSSPSMAHKSDMPVTSAFIQEVMRYCTIVPNSLGHKTTNTTTVFGFTLPKGTPVMPNLYATHFDPNTWQNPHEFNPGRHIDQDGKFVFSPKIIPFSLGKRACLGESLARMEVFLMFVGILQKFTITSGTSNLPSLTEGRLGFLYTTKPYKVILELR